MRLHMDSPLVVEVVSVGKLEFVGSKPRYNASHTKFLGEVAHFTLEYKPQTQMDRYPLAGLWVLPMAREYHICRLLNEAEPLIATDGETEIIQFCWMIPAQLRKPWGFLRWLATNMVKELVEIQRQENQEIAKALRA